METLLTSDRVTGIPRRVSLPAISHAFNGQVRYEKPEDLG
jgi:hypothetical protein